MRITRKISILTSLLIFFVILIVIGLSITFSATPSPTPTPLASRKSFEPNNLLIEEQWQKVGHVYVSEDPPMIFGADKIIVGFEFDRKITAFAARTGSTIWNISFKGPLLSLSADKEAIYVIVDSVEAHALDNGQALWQNEDARVRNHGGHWLDMASGNLNYYFHQNVTSYSVYNSFQEINKLSGRVEDRVVEELDVFFRKDGVKYIIKQNQLSAINTGNNQILWTINIDGYPKRLPIVLDQVMYFITTEPNGPSRMRSIYAVDLLTGDINWQIQEQILSNIAIGHETIFAIGFEGDILTWDIHTAEPIGKIIITPKIELERRYSNRFSVNANDQYLAAFYGDSQQLVVFEWLEPISMARFHGLNQPDISISK